MLNKWVSFINGEFNENESGDLIVGKTVLHLKANNFIHMGEIIKHVEDSHDYEFFSMWEFKTPVIA